MHLWLWKFKENFHFPFYRNVNSNTNKVKFCPPDPVLISQDRDTSSDAIAEKNLGDMSACVEILGRTTYDSLLRESSKPVHFLEDLV